MREENVLILIVIICIMFTVNIISLSATSYHIAAYKIDAEHKIDDVKK